MSFAHLACVAKPRSEGPIVIHQLDEHIERPYELLVVVSDALQPRDVSDRMEAPILRRRSAIWSVIASS
jgi:hypothetical protein